jgi:hypothetical protein
MATSQLVALITGILLNADPACSLLSRMVSKARKALFGRWRRSTFATGIESE